MFRNSGGSCVVVTQQASEFTDPRPVRLNADQLFRSERSTNTRASVTFASGKRRGKRRYAARVYAALAPPPTTPIVSRPPVSLSSSTAAHQASSTSLTASHFGSQLISSPAREGLGGYHQGLRIVWWTT